MIIKFQALTTYKNKAVKLGIVTYSQFVNFGKVSSLSAVKSELFLYKRYYLNNHRIVSQNDLFISRIIIPCD